MKNYRKPLISAAFLVLVLAAAVVVVYRRASRPPAIVRLLPEGDMVLYVNFRPIHLANLKQPPVDLAPDYKEFVQLTGIQFERDLDEVAVSRQPAADPTDTESSEIFTGRFDQSRLQDYLKKESTGTEQYENVTIFVIPHDGHMVRVAILGPGQVAVTNMEAANPMHTIIERSHGSQGEPWLVASHYDKIPLASVGWLIYKVPGRDDTEQLPGGMNFSFLRNATVIGSARYTGSLLLRADVLTQTDADATQLLNSANTFISLYRNIANSSVARGSDADVKAAFDSIQVQQQKNLVTFTASLSQDFLSKLMKAGKEAGAGREAGKEKETQPPLRKP